MPSTLPTTTRAPARAWIIRAALIVLVAALAGCSTIRLAYNSLDDLSYWWLDGYLDFDDAQSPRVRDDLGRLHAWHRRTELPHWLALLQRMEQMAPGEISPQQACEVFARMRERIAPVAEQAEPMATTLALGLSREQLAHLARKYEKNNAEFRKDWLRLPAAERHDKRYKRVLERAEMVYGTLDGPQRAVLRAQIEQSAWEPQRTLAERQRRQRDALDTLGRIAGQPLALAEARALLRAWFERGLHSPDGAYRAWQEQLVQEGCRTFSLTHNSTTPAQREMAVRRLRAWQRDLQELAGPQ